MTIIAFITEVYCFTDDEYKKLTENIGRGFNPKLSDREVITMEVVGEYLGFHKD